MECASCLLRYNSTSRAPYILQCGHSLCSQCLAILSHCSNCEKKIQKKPKINYSLMEIAQKDKTKIDKFIKVCFVGSSGVGKTSAVRMLTGYEYCEDLPSTIGYDFTFMDQSIHPFRVRYQFWDSAGQERYQAISPIHYKNAHVIVIVYDVTQNSSVNQVGYWLNEVYKHCPNKIKIILLGNKADLLEGRITRPIEKQVWQGVERGEIILEEISCRTGYGREKLWSLLAEYLDDMKRRKEKENSEVMNRIKLKGEEKKKTSCC